MKLDWKALRLVLGPAILVLGAGRGSIYASKSISPATFLLPGIMKADPRPPTPPNEAPPAETAAEGVA